MWLRATRWPEKTGRTSASGRSATSLTSFALAVLIKPQALLFAPLGLVAVVVFFCAVTLALNLLAAAMGQKRK